MENRRTKAFNKMIYLQDHLSAFIQSPSKGLNQVSGCLNAINSHPAIQNSQQDAEKRNILEKCLALFRSPKFKILIDREKEKYGILNQEDVTGETRAENLRKVIQLSQELSCTLSEIIFGDLKRKYNMGSKASKGMVSTITTPEGAVKKDVRLNNIEKPLAPIVIQNSFGNNISIQHIGTLSYSTRSSDEYIFKFRISRWSYDENEKTFDVFSNIDLNKLKEDAEYCNVVVQELLSENNIDFSNADGYIGEISDTTGASEQLRVGEQKDIPGFYRYQISSTYALEYNGERIEAIRAYKQQENQKEEELEI